MSISINQPYHLVEKRPWPILASLGALFITRGLVKWFHRFRISLLNIGLFTVLLVRVQWWRDVSREGRYQGLHTQYVVTGLRWGIILFIVSEVCFFFSFFWGFFHSRLCPTIELGGVWPPTRIVALNCFKIPLLNTAILLASGVSVTWRHHAIIEGNHDQGVYGLLVTIFLGLVFTIIQGSEYYEASFCVRDSVYGRRFFVATGFHGLHVIIGTRFLLSCCGRLVAGLFSSNHHIGLEGAIWYWHFVDVVWLFLFVSIYWWGS